MTAWGSSPAAYEGRVELVYDPEDPRRASRPLTVGFAFRTLLLAAVALVPTLVFLSCVRSNLPW
ncbi:hypothetical protein ACSNOK_08455 [Streptomyces sp. URMC 126]|uniref:hypothetical protein n=1 Tax=Streptomyces sp. URMC 126 TaxID=3423401 RepID=UPI003F199A20